jgi:murein DD-endopeptidase MepM/ murein hydrolase activator NlpD
MLSAIAITLTLTASAALTPATLPAGPAVEQKDDSIIDIMWEERTDQIAELTRKRNYSLAIQNQAPGAADSFLRVPLNMIEAKAIFLPVASNDTSSHFGYRPKPCDACSSWHRGLDFTPGWGEPVFAIAQGEVIDVGYNSRGYGRYIYIEHEIDGQKYVTAYAHLTRNGVIIEEGDTVRAGQKIAKVGNTGTSTGAHLHFEVRDSSGTHLDPEEFFREYYTPLLTD